MALKAKTTSTAIDVPEMNQATASFCILGNTPLIFNRMSEKAKRQLLLPSGRMNEADKASRLKHDPETEYRDSVYKNPGDNPPTRLKIPSAAFKGAMETAALDMPGTKRTEIGRLVSVPVMNFDCYGIPKLLMSTVRSADINRTPDIRTRAIVEHWCCVVHVSYVQPKLRLQPIIHLMAAAGMIAGVGDWRQEKGSGNFGTFKIVAENDAEFLRIIKTGARKQQDMALAEYECFDEETFELLDWYNHEILSRGPDRPGGPGGRKRRTANDDVTVQEAA